MHAGSTPAVIVYSRLIVSLKAFYSENAQQKSRYMQDNVVMIRDFDQASHDHTHAWNLRVITVCDSVV